MRTLVSMYIIECKGHVDLGGVAHRVAPGGLGDDRVPGHSGQWAIRPQC